MLDLTDWQNKKYTTRDGKPVRILCIDAKGDQPIVGLFPEKFRQEAVSRWCNNGDWYISGQTSNLDLINAKTKREGWVNVYGKMRDNSIAFLSDAYSSKNEADNYEMYGRIACVRIEWEE